MEKTKNTTDIIQNNSQVFKNNSFADVISNTTKTYSELLKKIRKCDTCPLRPIQTKTGMKYQCTQWQKDRADCPIDDKQFSQEMQSFIELKDTGAMTQLRYLAVKQMIRANICEQAEMIVKGRPGFYTNEFSKSAGVILKDLVSLENGIPTEQENNNSFIFNVIQTLREGSEKKHEENKMVDGQVSKEENNT